MKNGRGTRGQIVNIHWIMEKVREFQRNIYFCFIDTLKPLTVRITANCGKFLKRWEYQTTLLAFWETFMQVKKQQLEPDMEQGTEVKSGKEYIKPVYCHPAYLTFMQSISWEVPGWWITSWKEDCREKYKQPQMCRLYHPNGRKWKRRVKNLP